jgi:hypothetical protein
MTIRDINKWISGETELFFDARSTPPSVSADSNPGAKRSSAHLSIRKFVHPAIIAFVGAFAAVAVVSSVSFMQHSAELLRASDPKSQLPESGATFTRAIAAEHENVSTPPMSLPKEVIPTPAVPLRNDPTQMLSDAQRAAFLSQVGIWYNERAKAATASIKKPSPTQGVSRRHWPQYSFRAQSDPDRGEATRLMVDELQQRGVATVIKLAPPR